VAKVPHHDLHLLFSIAVVTASNTGLMARPGRMKSTIVPSVRCTINTYLIVDKVIVQLL
jgi:hypothetical protein